MAAEHGRVEAHTIWLWRSNGLCLGSRVVHGSVDDADKLAREIIERVAMCDHVTITDENDRAVRFLSRCRVHEGAL